jgi:hypothetical protein
LESKANQVFLFLFCLHAHLIKREVFVTITKHESTRMGEKEKAQKERWKNNVLKTDFLES